MTKERLFNIAVGASSKTKTWKNKTMQWSELVEKLSHTTRTPETVAEYKKLSKAEKGKIKDVGGFVGGTLKNGRRLKNTVVNRSLLSLDIDYYSEDIEDLVSNIDYAFCLYSTHSHTADNQRYRLIIPLDRDVSTDEYKAIGRKVASKFNIEIFDPTTYEPERLMYWPSTPIDGDYIFKCSSDDTKFLKADDILNEYTFGWQDMSSWPISSQEKEIIKKSIKKQEDPLTKKGIIGAFCRAYTITEAISEFLNEIYVPGADETRYTYAEGSTTGGVVIYDDKFSYSHHGTDPASNILCNAFDLVRIHKFGHLDEDSTETGSKLPSFKAMEEFARADTKTKGELIKEKVLEAQEDFKNADLDWLGELELTSKGAIKNNYSNIKMIIENDMNLKGKIVYDEFSNKSKVIGKLPWARSNIKSSLEDSDYMNMCIYIEETYKVTVSDERLRKILIANIQSKAINPPKEYLNSLSWDGVNRIDTLLIDYFGAEDTEYTRVVTRKWLCGAVARIFIPGIKFDYMLVLIGDQGVGKSTFFKKLGKSWFTDSIQDVEGNQAIEKTIGSWIIEFGELQAFSKAESNAIKRFISATEDKTRLAFERSTGYFKRQCVFAGTTNNDEFLKDDTGNRRFWPVNFKGKKIRKLLDNDNFENSIDQIWAEAVYRWKELKEPLFLNREQEKLAEQQQVKHIIKDDRQGLIEEYLEMRLPENWDKCDIYARRNFIHDNDFGAKESGNILRDKVCILEIWVECFEKNRSDLKRSDSNQLASIMNNIEGWERLNKSVRFKLYGVQKAYIRKK
ncbi:virulence-associated E family protein [Clostridium cadaveris]|uniref:virulence-associated E family protein n=1 Tax=Clostridium cadaveris TaxID=1529 RepID=UPI001E5F26B2|nr:virulence-associated E family protein [Clostridium cadaveris]UFH66261.1 virulence-associated E family protein [Clostridium cadaveris]